MSAHVPAWKRLGLKLKGPASGEAIPSPGGANARAKPAAQVPNAHQARVNGSPASALKRKLPSSASTPNDAASATPNKKPRRGDQSAADQGTPSSLRKSVSFADDTKASAKDKPEKKKAKKKKTPKASDAPKADFSLEPSLIYIRQWHTDRASWKFNKNHQTLLIKYLFDGDKVPSADIPIFYQYIRDLKGFVRTRLRETAAEIKQKDMDAGAGAFPAALKDKETKQKEYEETISRFLQDLHQHQQQRREPSGSGSGSASSKNANGKRTLDEVEYVLRIATPEVKQRLLKRIRAELVVDELSDSEESASTATATSTSSASSASTAAAAVDGTTTATTTTAATGRSDGSQQPAKRRRLRNVRTAIGDDDSSSSESESDESGSEDSSSDSDESDDEAMDVDVDVAAAADSSSSSSSSSEAESGSEDDDDDDESGEESSSSDED
jgi:hypothetical protein